MLGCRGPSADYDIRRLADKSARSQNGAPIFQFRPLSLEWRAEHLSMLEIRGLLEWPKKLVFATSRRGRFSDTSHPDSSPAVSPSFSNAECAWLQSNPSQPS
jgi:hypothetical protein